MLILTPFEAKALFGDEGCLLNRNVCVIMMVIIEVNILVLMMFMITFMEVDHPTYVCVRAPLQTFILKYISFLFFSPHFLSQNLSTCVVI